jgi:hypothetical protein
MNMVMDIPASGAAASDRIRSSRSGLVADRPSRTQSGDLNLKGRMSQSPEVYTGLQRQPFGE